MARLSPAQQAARKAVRESRSKAIRTAPGLTGRRWDSAGTVQQYGRGLVIRITDGRHTGVYAVKPVDAPGLLIGGDPAGLHTLRGSVAGTVEWSESGDMLLVRFEGEPRYGAYQIVGRQILAHYLRSDQDEIPVVSPAERAPQAVPA